MRLVAGVDIGGTRTKIGVVNPEVGTVVFSEVISTPRSGPAALISRIATVCRAWAVKEIGVGVPGFVRSGTVLTTFGVVPWLEGVELAEYLQDCRVGNDAQLIAIGESIFGAGQGAERVLAITLGTGVGIGLRIAGTSTSEAVEHMAGHIKIRESGPDCFCGRKGCLESLVNAAAVEARSGVSPSAAFLAVGWIEEYLDDLAVGLNNYIYVYGPDRIVLGGGLVHGLAAYLPDLQAKLTAVPYPGYTVSLVSTNLFENAGVVGAAHLTQL